MESFRYTPLDLEGRSFRLLRLLSGQGSLIRCEIFEAWLEGEDTIPYEALSYAWGDLATPRDVRLDDRRLAITENLYVTLEHLRNTREDRILWVDAICINQLDERERGHQVGQMRDIYSRAEQVIFWLGTATPNVELVMTALKHLERRSQKRSVNNWDFRDLRWCRLSPETQSSRVGAVTEKQKSGLQELIQRPWFRRIWILQKVAHARHATVCAGNMAVSSRVFVVAPRLFSIFLDEHCQAVLDIMPGLSRNKSWWSQTRDLGTLMDKFKDSNASDPRDMVYALLGLISAGTNTYSLQPDYTKTTAQVIDDVVLLLTGLHAGSYASMDEFLHSINGIMPQALLPLARWKNVKDITGFLQSRNLNCETNPEILIAAASNEKFGNELVELFLKGARNVDYTIDPDILVVAASKGRYSVKIVEMLLRNLDVQIKMPVIAAALHNAKSGEAILRYIVANLDQTSQNRRLIVRYIVSAAKAGLGCAPSFIQWLSEQDDPEFSFLGEESCGNVDKIENC